jgi:hypothetical protein
MLINELTAEAPRVSAAQSVVIVAPRRGEREVRFADVLPKARLAARAIAERSAPQTPVIVALASSEALAIALLAASTARRRVVVCDPLDESDPVLGMRRLHAKVRALGQALMLTEAVDVPMLEAMLPRDPTLATLPYLAVDAAGSDAAPDGETSSFQFIDEAALVPAAEALASVRANDVIACALPQSEPLGLAGGVLVPWARRQRAVWIMTDTLLAQPLRWIEILARNAATVAVAPAWLLNALARSLGTEPIANDALARMRELFLLGYAPPQDTLVALRAVGLSPERVVTLQGIHDEPEVAVLERVLERAHPNVRCHSTAMFAQDDRHVLVEIERRVATTRRGDAMGRNDSTRRAVGDRRRHGSIDAFSPPSPLTVDVATIRSTLQEVASAHLKGRCKVHCMRAWSLPRLPSGDVWNEGARQMYLAGEHRAVEL